MTTSKKVFFGSLFEFSNIGAEEIFNNLRHQYIDPESVPFVSYDSKTHLFVCEIHATDQDLIPAINAQIDAYITLHGRKPHEPLELDRLRPIDGTTLRDNATDTGPHEIENHPFFDTDSSSEDDEAQDGSENQNAVSWKPRCEDITILDKDIAIEIADTTNCTLIPVRDGRTIQLRHGNLQQGLDKLRILEDVLTLCASHRSKLTACVNDNILLLASTTGTTIKYVRPVQPLCGFDRIVLDASQMPLYSRIVLAEARYLRGGEWIKPVNLDLEDVFLTARQGLASTFKRSKLPVVGNPKNAEPRPPSKENSQASGEVQRPNSPTKFLGQKDTERVEEWRGNVDPQAAPTLPPAEPPPEEEKKPGRRRVKLDSEDEEEEEGNNISAFPVPKKQPSLTKDHNTHDMTGRSLPSHTPVLASRNIDRSTHLQATRTGTRSLTSSTMTKARLPPKSPRSALPTNNRFDVIDPNPGADQDELSPEDASLEQLDGKAKQLSVTFKELDLLSNASNQEGDPSPSRAKKPAVTNIKTPDQGAQNHVSRSLSGSSRKLTAQSRHKNSDNSFHRDADTTEPGVKGHNQQHSSQKRELFTARSGYRGDGQSTFQPRRQNLIDVSSDQFSTQPLMPPPGLDYRSGHPVRDVGAQMETQPEDHQPISGPDPAAKREEINDDSPSTSGSSGYPTDLPGFNPQFVVPRRNINFLREQIGARLKAQMDASKETSVTDGSSSSNSALNRKQKDDEYSTRKYRQTMSQKMARPAKSQKNDKKQETKAEREARIAKAKAEAYGDTISAKPPPRVQSTNQQSGSSEDMSARKRQILQKNVALAGLHQDTLAEMALQTAADRLLETWEPILQATRAFKGMIKAEIKLGQALILRGHHNDDNKLYNLKDWLHLVNHRSNHSNKVTFTSILTMNGQDIDRMLEIKADTGSPKLWDRKSSEPTSVSFEFACQDKSGHDFVLVVDQDGNHNLRKAESTIGQIALHAPSQVWDACATVSGTMEILHPSDEVLTGVQQFKESLYIPGGHKAAVYYRLPANNAFTIRTIVLKSVSTHDCLLLDRGSIQLHVTEVKALAHSSNPTDKKLYRSYESSHEVMMVEGRIHYEVALADKSLTKMFENNPAIEVGELASIDGSDEKILRFAQARGLIEVSSYMLERIDWMGASNIGTLRRIFDNAADQRASIAHTLPPNFGRNVAIPMGTTAPPTVAAPTYQSHLSRIGGGAGTNIAAPEPVVRQLQGVRTNTAAELYRDPATGDLFYYGLGGARVPVVDEQLEPTKIDGLGPVVPDDSASQVGDVKGKMAANNKARFIARDDKPAGFW